MYVPNLKFCSARPKGVEADRAHHCTAPPDFHNRGAGIAPKATKDENRNPHTESVSTRVWDQ